MKRVSMKTKLLAGLLSLCMMLSFLPVTVSAETTANYITDVTVTYDNLEYKAGDTPVATAKVTDGEDYCSVAYEKVSELYQKEEGGVWYNAGRYWYSDADKMEKLSSEKKITEFEAGKSYSYTIVLTIKPGGGRLFSKDETTVHIKTDDYEFDMTSINLEVTSMGAELYIYNPTSFDIPAESSSESSISAASIANVKFDYQAGDAPQKAATVPAEDAEKYEIEYEYWEEMQLSSEGFLEPVAYWYSDESKYSAVQQDKKIAAFEEGKSYMYSISLKAKDGYTFIDQCPVTINDTAVNARNVIKNQTGLFITAVKTIKPTASQPKDDNTTPEQPKDDNTTPEQPKDDNTTPEQPKDDNTTPEQPKDDNTTPEQPKDDNTTPEQPKDDNTTPEQPKDDNTTPEQPKDDNTTPDQPASDNTDGSDDGSTSNDWNDMTISVDWADVSSRLDAAIQAANDRNVNVLTGKDVKVSADILKKIADRKVTLALQAGNGVALSVSGRNNKQIQNELNLTVTNQDTIPAQAKNAVMAGALNSKNILITENSPMQARISLHVGFTAEYAGKYANLYYYDAKSGQMKLMGSYQINKDGQSMFALPHGGQYVVTVTNTASGAVVTDGYTVVPGDTMSRIAVKLGTTLKALKAANPQITDMNKIRPGQVINVR